MPSAARTAAVQSQVARRLDKKLSLAFSALIDTANSVIVLLSVENRHDFDNDID